MSLCVREREPDRARVGAPPTVAARGWFWISESSPKPLPVFAKPTLPLSAIKMSNSPCERARATDRQRARQRALRGRSPQRRTHALDDVEVVGHVSGRKYRFPGSIFGKKHSVHNLYKLVNNLIL